MHTETHVTTPSYRTYRPARSDGAPFVVATFNCAGLREERKRANIFTYLKSISADVVCLQETHCDSRDTAERWAREWSRGSCWSSSSTTTYSGVAVLVQSETSSLRPRFDDPHSRILVVELICNKLKGAVKLASVYAPARLEERRVWLSSLPLQALERVDIIAGDLNCYADPLLDRIPPRTMNPSPYYALWAQTLARLGLQDTARVIHPSRPLVSR
jgi:exonuclease III